MFFRNHQHTDPHWAEMNSLQSQYPNMSRWELIEQAKYQRNWYEDATSFGFFFAMVAMAFVIELAAPIWADVILALALLVTAGFAREALYYRRGVSQLRGKPARRLSRLF